MTSELPGLALSRVGYAPFPLPMAIAAALCPTPTMMACSSNDASVTDGSIADVPNADDDGAAPDATAGDAGSINPCGEAIEGWSFQPMGMSGSDPSLTIDSQGAVHVAYLRDGGLHYVTNASGSWESELVGEGFEITRATSIGVDPDGHVHVAFGQVTGSNTHYATNRTGAWEVEPIDSAGLGGAIPKLQIDPEGRPVIVYRGGPHDTLDHLRVARPGEDEWQIERYRAYTEMPDFELTSSGTMHLVTSGTSTLPALRYWTDAGGSLEGEVVAQGGPGALTLTPDETVHLAYTQRRDVEGFDLGDLIHASRATGATSWSFEILQHDAFARNGHGYLDLASDASGGLHLLYDPSSNPCNELRYLSNASGAWQTSALPGRSGRFQMLIHENTMHVVLGGTLVYANLPLSD
jgi:hypothetical protein